METYSFPKTNNKSHQTKSPAKNKKIPNDSEGASGDKNFASKISVPILARLDRRVKTKNAPAGNIN